jgi:hypothetical protein
VDTATSDDVNDMLRLAVSVAEKRKLQFPEGLSTADGTVATSAAE